MLANVTLFKLKFSSCNLHGTVSAQMYVALISHSASVCAVLDRSVRMAFATGLYAFAASISVISNTDSESLQLFLTTNSDHFGLIKQLPSFITCGLICIILTELVEAAALYLGSQRRTCY